MRIDKIKSKYSIDWALFKLLKSKEFQECEFKLVISKDRVKYLVVQTPRFCVLIDWGLELYSKIINTYTYGFVAKDELGKIKQYCDIISTPTKENLDEFLSYVPKCLEGDYAIANIKCDNNIFHDWLLEKGYSFVDVER